jgi:hypothetical protein
MVAVVEHPQLGISANLANGTLRILGREKPIPASTDHQERAGNARGSAFQGKPPQVFAGRRLIARLQTINERLLGEQRIPVEMLCQVISGSQHHDSTETPLRRRRASGEEAAQTDPQHADTLGIDIGT